ncbi:hypothetical protein Ms3S1_15540 [Methylosinus sp. 3S-1]|nr:hypothetical protein A8B73_14305 [Methylosinus sp. 3S-1]
MSDLRGVESNDPHSLSFVIGADMVSTHHERPSGVSDLLQCAEHSVCAASSEARDIFKSDPTRSQISDEADGREEEPGALAVDSLAARVGCARVLAGRASDEQVGTISEIGNNSPCGELSNIVIHPHAGEIRREHGAPPRIGLAGRNRAIAGAMEAERPAAGAAAKEIDDGRPASARHFSLSRGHLNTLYLR